MITSHKWCDRCGKLVGLSDKLKTVELGIQMPHEAFEFCEECFDSILKNWEMQRDTVRAFIEKDVKGDK